jgi:hypothetical protein
MVGLGESDNPTIVFLGYFERTVRTLHVAYQYLVKVLDSLQYLLQMLLGIIGVDDY